MNALKKWLPYIVAAVLGIGVAVLMFMPDTATAPKKAADKPAGRPTIAAKVENGLTLNGGDGPTQSDAQRILAERLAGTPPPDPSTLRPQNAGELAHAERSARPFNVHYKLVAADWSSMAALVAPTSPDLAKECSAMDLYLRDQSKLADADLNTEEAIRNELALEKKIYALNIDNPALKSKLDYVNNVANTVFQGGDPAAIPKPGKG